MSYGVPPPSVQFNGEAVRRPVPRAGYGSTGVVLKPARMPWFCMNTQ